MDNEHIVAPSRKKKRDRYQQVMQRQRGIGKTLKKEEDRTIEATANIIPPKETESDTPTTEAIPFSLARARRRSNARRDKILYQRDKNFGVLNGAREKVETKIAKNIELDTGEGNKCSDTLHKSWKNYTDRLEDIDIKHSEVQHKAEDGWLPACTIRHNNIEDKQVELQAPDDEIDTTEESLMEHKEISDTVPNATKTGRNGVMEQINFGLPERETPKEVINGRDVASTKIVHMLSSNSSLNLETEKILPLPSPQTLITNLNIKARSYKRSMEKEAKRATASSINSSESVLSSSPLMKAALRASQNRKQHQDEEKKHVMVDSMETAKVSDGNKVVTIKINEIQSEKTDEEQISKPLDIRAILSSKTVGSASIEQSDNLELNAEQDVESFLRKKFFLKSFSEAKLAVSSIDSTMETNIDSLLGDESFNKRDKGNENIQPNVNLGDVPKQNDRILSLKESTKEYSNKESFIVEDIKSGPDTNEKHDTIESLDEIPAVIKQGCESNNNGKSQIEQAKVVGWDTRSVLEHPVGESPLGVPDLNAAWDLSTIPFIAEVHQSKLKSQDETNISNSSVWNLTVPGFQQNLGSVSSTSEPLEIVQSSKIESLVYREEFTDGNHHQTLVNTQDMDYRTDGLDEAVKGTGIQQVEDDDEALLGSFSNANFKDEVQHLQKERMAMYTMQRSDCSISSDEEEENESLLQQCDDEKNFEGSVHCT